MKTIYLLLSFLVLAAPMSVLSPNLTVYAQSSTVTFKSTASIDGFIEKWGPTYPPKDYTVVDSSYSGMGVGQAYLPDPIAPGQRPNDYFLFRSYVSFDTSSVPQNAIITGAKLKLMTQSYSSPVNFVVKVWGGDLSTYVWNVHGGIYGPSLDASDWNAGTTLVATWSTGNFPGNGIYVEIPIPAVQIDKAGRTQFVLNSSREGVAPTGNQNIFFYSGNTSGKEPTLEVTYYFPLTVWQQPYVSHPTFDWSTAPLNLSTTMILYPANKALYPGYELRLTLTVSIYQYQMQLTDSIVHFRTALLVESFSPKGIRVPVYAGMVIFILTKDTVPNNSGDQIIRYNLDNPNYNQAYGLVQSVQAGGGNILEGYAAAVEFAAGLACEPLGIILGLIDVGKAFYASAGPVVDYQDARTVDPYAQIWWREDPTMGFTNTDPVRQYCQSAVKWLQVNNVNPQSYYGLDISAQVNLDSPLYANWIYGKMIVNMPPIHLQILHSGGGGGCVLRNTRIMMADHSTMPVQEVKQGDKILGYDVERGAFVTETVTSNSQTAVDYVLAINKGLLYLTPTDQPIYTDHGWIKNPQDLVIGWHIYRPAENSWLTIKNLERIEGHFLVYDLRATKTDTFIGNGILLDMKT